jgi:hypothetical protein
MNRFAFSILLFVPLFAGCEKWRFDEQAKQLCARDGGITVYETVTLPPERFDKYGQVRFTSRDLAAPSDEFFYDWEITYLRKGDPDLVRHHFKLVRRRDGKVLGESVSYSRRGGDLPLGFQRSSFSCPTESGNARLGERVFARKDSRGEGK